MKQEAKISSVNISLQTSVWEHLSLTHYIGSPFLMLNALVLIIGTFLSHSLTFLRGAVWFILCPTVSKAETLGTPILKCAQDGCSFKNPGLVLSVSFHPSPLIIKKEQHKIMQMWWRKEPETETSCQFIKRIMELLREWKVNSQKVWCPFKPGVVVLRYYLI